MRRAVIDIGTNTVKILVGDVTALPSLTITPLYEDAVTTRLGAGVNATRRLDADAMRRTVEAVAAFAKRAKELGATQIQTFATSAARDAENGREFLDAAQRAAGVTVRVLSGDEEAQFVFAGVTSDGAFLGKTIRTIDIGGGSTEFCLGDAGELLARRSLDIGAVRLTEMFLKSDPPSECELAYLSEHVRGELGKLPESLRCSAPVSGAGRVQTAAGDSRPTALFIATGGTVTTLAAMELNRRMRLGTPVATSVSEETKVYPGVDHYELTAATVCELVDWLHKMPLAQRKEITGLSPARADIIVAGAAILWEAMQFFGAASVVVSVRGLRYGALAERMKDEL